jgi:hypothetical protein
MRLYGKWISGGIVNRSLSALLVTLVAALGSVAQANTQPVFGAPAQAVLANDVLAQSDLNGCNWQTSFVQTLASRSGGRLVVMTDDALAKASHKVNVTVSRLSSMKSGGGKPRMGYRLDFLQDGKLVTSKNIERLTPRDLEPDCAQISSLSVALANDFADWLAPIRLPECDVNCSGLHPTEAVMISRFPRFRTPDAPGIISQCSWLKEAMPKLRKDFENTPGMRLKITFDDIERHTGRRLLLRFGKIDVEPADPQARPYAELRAELHDGPMLVAGKFFTKTARPAGSECGTLARLGDDLLDDIQDWLHAGPTLPADWK